MGVTQYIVCFCFALFFLTQGTNGFAGYPGLNITWRHPLLFKGAAVPGKLPPLASDEQTVYAASDNNTLYAIRAVDGKVLWEKDAKAIAKSAKPLSLFTAHQHQHAMCSELSSSPSTIDVFAEHADRLYCRFVCANTTSDRFPFTLVALRRSDGEVLGSVSMGSSGYLLPYMYYPSKAGLVIVNGSMTASVDKDLQRVLWQHTLSPLTKDGHLHFNDNVDVNGEYVAELHQDVPGPYPVGDLVSYNATTGALLCRISNVSTVFSPPTFHVTKNGFSWAWKAKVLNLGGGWIAIQVSLRVYDLQRCTANVTSIYNENFLGVTVGFEILPPAHDSDMDTHLQFLLYNISNSLTVAGGQQWFLASAAIDLSGNLRWGNVSLANPRNETLHPSMPPVLSRSSISPDVIIVFVNGVLTAIHTNGTKLWEYTEQPVFAYQPNALQELAFFIDNPVHEGAIPGILVPNVYGYSIVYQGSENITEGNLLSMYHVRQFVDSTTDDDHNQQRFVTFVDASGDLGAAYSGARPIPTSTLPRDKHPLLSTAAIVGIVAAGLVVLAVASVWFIGRERCAGRNGKDGESHQLLEEGVQR